MAGFLIPFGEVTAGGVGRLYANEQAQNSATSLLAALAQQYPQMQPFAAAARGGAPARGLLEQAIKAYPQLTAGRQLVQNPDGTWTLVDLATAKPGTVIGPQVDYAKRLTGMLDSGALPDALKGVAQQAIRSGDKGFQEQVYESAVKLLGSPTFEKTNLNPAEQRQALEEALPYVPPQLRPLVQRAIQPSSSPALVAQAYKALNPAFGASMYGMRITPFSYTSPTGETITTPYAMPARGGPASPVITGGAGIPRGTALASAGGLPSMAGTPIPRVAGSPLTSHKLPVRDAALVVQIQGLIPQLEDLRRRFEELGPQRWNKNRLIGYGEVRWLKTGLKDQQVQDTMQKAIQVESAAKMAIAAASGTRAVRFIESTEGHVPSGRGDYNYNMGAIRTLLDPNGPYYSTLNLYGFPGAKMVTPEPSADMPPASMIPEGTKMRFQDGKVYTNVGGVVRMLP